MATVQTLLDVLLLVHGVITTGYGTLALVHPALLDTQASPIPADVYTLGRWHPPTPRSHRVPGILHEALSLALEGGQYIPGVLGPVFAHYSQQWKHRVQQGFHAVSSTGSEGTSHALWFRLYGLHTLLTGVVATALALGTHDRRAKLTYVRVDAAEDGNAYDRLCSVLLMHARSMPLCRTATGLWLYILLAWLVVSLDARAGGVAAQARGASLILGSLAAVYTLILGAIYILWPRAAGQGHLFTREPHVHHHERQVEHEKRHH